MTRKLITLALLGAATVPALSAIGCSSGSGNQPYSLTGKSEEQAARDHQAWRQRMMYTDEKGHYHPELEAQHRALRSMPN